VARSYLRSFALSAALPFFAVLARSQCFDPPSPSVVVCTPSPDATVAYIPDIAVRFTPANGTEIARIIIYDNDRKMSDTGRGQDGGDIRDAAVFNGTHHLVVKAWDTAGNFYQAKETFHVVGQGFAPCNIPDKLGVNFCVPTRTAVLGLQFPAGAAARGLSKISNLSFYLDGVLQQSLDNSPRATIFITVQQQGIQHIVKVVATDARGHQYSASKKVEAAYTYSQHACFTSCVPGIDIVAPLDEDYVSDSFALNMQILDNPNPITSMTAYLDNNVIAVSNGPTLQQQITGAPAGTHILTVTGVDNEGIVYRIQENINIDISK
jgi:hypothetical protein